MKSNTQTIWLDFLQMPEYLPTKAPKQIDAHCWLCAGETHGQGWNLKTAIGGMFTDHAIAKAPHSQSLCGSCAAFLSGDAWLLACEQHGQEAWFPLKDGKKPVLSNWMFYSHVFSPEGWRRCDRSAARAMLLCPPEPPFVITLAAVGKKHVIFRAPVNYDRDRFFVQLDEYTICVDRSLLTIMLQQFEAAYALGLSKDSLLTGEYNQAACMKVGVEKWRQIELIMKDYRRRDPALLKVVAFIAKKEKIT